MDPAAKKRRLEELMGGADGGGIAGAAPPAAPPAPPSRDAYVVNANEAVFFRLVTCPEDMDSAPSFNPEFTHQVFREEETIFGFADLEARAHALNSRGWSEISVRLGTGDSATRSHCALQPVTISLHAVTFHALVEITHGGTAPSVLGPPDKVEARLKEAFPAGFETDKQQFVATLRQLGPSPPLPAGFSTVSLEGAREGSARVVHLALNTDEARAWHARMAPLALFFIDAATHLDTRRDSRWELLVALLPGSDGGDTHVVAGFATLYRFYAFPADTRLRLSQILVPTPLQRRGVATTLLQAVRTVALSNGAMDVTVEDPTEALQKLREIVDLRAARDIPEVADAARSAVAGAQSAPTPEARRASLDCPALVTAQLRERLRLCKPQIRIVWEALLFLAARDARADPTGPAAAAFRESVERRLRGIPTDASTATEVPRKFVVDLEDEHETREAPVAQEDDKLTMYFIMAKGQPTGQGRAKPAAVLDESIQEQQKTALEEALRVEMQRLTALAMAVK